MKETIGERMLMECHIKPLIKKAEEFYTSPRITLNPFCETGFTVGLTFYGDYSERFVTKWYESIADLNNHLLSLETYKVGDRLQVGENTYLICADKGTFLVNLETGRTYGRKLLTTVYDSISRSDVAFMFNYHSGVEFVKINKPI